MSGDEPGFIVIATSSAYLLRCYALTHQQRFVSADLHGSKLGMTVVADLRCY